MRPPAAAAVAPTAGPTVEPASGSAPWSADVHVEGLPGGDGKGGGGHGAEATCAPHRTVRRPGRAPCTGRHDRDGGHPLWDCERLLATGVGERVGHRTRGTSARRRHQRQAHGRGTEEDADGDDARPPGQPAGTLALRANPCAVPHLLLPRPAVTCHSSEHVQLDSAAGDRVAWEGTRTGVGRQGFAAGPRPISEICRRDVQRPGTEHEVLVLRHEHRVGVGDHLYPRCKRPVRESLVQGQG